MDFRGFLKYYLRKKGMFIRIPCTNTRDTLEFQFFLISAKEMSIFKNFLQVIWIFHFNDFQLNFGKIINFDFFKSSDPNWIFVDCDTLYQYKKRFRISHFHFHFEFLKNSLFRLVDFFLSFQWRLSKILKKYKFYVFMYPDPNWIVLDFSSTIQQKSEYF